MPIKAGDRREWAGAGSKLLPPITAGDCANTADFNELVLHESKPGRGVVVRAGMAFARRTPAEIGVMCGLVTPVVNSVDPAAAMWSYPREVYGSGFGSVVWRAWISRGAQWSDPDAKYARNVNQLYWGNVLVVVGLGTPCLGTGVWYMYIENQAQLVNAAGREFTVYSCG